MDPGLVLSTTATASAALVAIVGGLLVARVVSLATERSGVLQRRNDLQTRLEQARQRSDALERRLLDRDADEVINDHLEELAALPETPDLAGMIRRSEVSHTPEEIRPYIDRELKKMQAARQVLEPLFDEGIPDRDLADLAEDGLVEVPGDEEWRYREVFMQLIEEHTPPRPPGAFNIPVIPTLEGASRTIRAIRSTHEQAELAQLRRDAEHTRHEVGALKVQLEQAEVALSRVSNPVGVGWGALVLGYFATAGTLTPLALMAAGLRERWAAWLAVVLFATGVVALLWYVIGSVRRMFS